MQYGFACLCFVVKVIVNSFRKSPGVCPINLEGAPIHTFPVVCTSLGLPEGFWPHILGKEHVSRLTFPFFTVAFQ